MENRNQKIKNRLNELLEFVKPRFSELTTFQAAVSFILVFIFYPDVFSKLFILISEDINKAPGSFFIFAFLVLLAIAGVGFSIWHVFIHREKDDIEKWIMGAFAVIMTGLAGFFATLELLPERISVLLIFPIMNYLWGVLLMDRLLEPHKAITDDDANIIDVIISIIIIIIVFLIAYYPLGQSWSVAFSMCMSISSMLLLLYKRIVYTIKMIA